MPSKRWVHSCIYKPEENSSGVTTNKKYSDWCLLCGFPNNWHQGLCTPSLPIPEPLAMLDPERSTQLLSQDPLSSPFQTFTLPDQSAGIHSVLNSQAHHTGAQAGSTARSFYPPETQSLLPARQSCLSLSIYNRRHPT